MTHLARIIRLTDIVDMTVDMNYGGYDCQLPADMQRIDDWLGRESDYCESPYLAAFQKAS